MNILVDLVRPLHVFGKIISVQTKLLGESVSNFQKRGSILTERNSSTLIWFIEFMGDAVDLFSSILQAFKAFDRSVLNCRDDKAERGENLTINSNEEDKRSQNSPRRKTFLHSTVASNHCTSCSVVLYNECAAAFSCPTFVISATRSGSYSRILNNIGLEHIVWFKMLETDVTL